ncbi:hypothetical protein D3C75_888950 [compost metagenome]
MLQPYPRAAPDAFNRTKLLKADDNPVHGHVVEQDVPGYYGQGHEDQPFIFLVILDDGFQQTRLFVYRMLWLRCDLRQGGNLLCMVKWGNFFPHPSRTICRCR